MASQIESSQNLSGSAPACTGPNFYKAAWATLTLPKNHQASLARPQVGDFGISLTSGAVPGRAASPIHIEAGLANCPTDDWRQETQLKYGAVYQITAISQDNNWLEVALPLPNKCKVWIESHRHTYLPKKVYMMLINNHELLPPATERKELISILDGRILQPIAIEPGSRLPLFDEQTKTCLGPDFSVCRVVDARTPVRIDSNKTLDNLFGIIKNMLGQPYTWGGLDCSAFIHHVYSSFGVELPQNSAAQQSKHGTQVKDLESAESGDCIFYGIDKVTHVGILLEIGGNRYLAHAKQRVRIELMSADGLTEKYKGNGRHIITIKRFASFKDTSVA